MDSIVLDGMMEDAYDSCRESWTPSDATDQPRVVVAEPVWSLHTHTPQTGHQSSLSQPPISHKTLSPLSSDNEVNNDDENVPPPCTASLFASSPLPIYVRPSSASIPFQVMILKSENDRGKEDVKWSISQAVVHAQGNGKSRKLTPDARIHIALHDKDNEDCDSGMLFEPDSPLAHRTRSRLAAQSDLPFASRWREGASHSPITKVLKSVRKRSMLFKSSKKDLPGKKSPPAAKVMKKNAGGTVASGSLLCDRE